MRSALELDTEVRRLRRTMRRLIGVMTLALVVGVAVVVAALAASLSTADKQALQAFTDGARAPDGAAATASAAKQPHWAPASAARETVGRAAAAARAAPAQPPAAATPAPDPRRTAEQAPTKMLPRKPSGRAATVQNTKGDADASATERPHEEPQATPRAHAPHRHYARARPTDEQGARAAGEPSDRVTLFAPRRPAYAPPPEEPAPDERARAVRRDGEPSGGPFGMFGALFGAHDHGDE